jgi:hypothetical protein
MQHLRKYYMADANPSQGGNQTGPSKKDVENTESVSDSFSKISSTLKSIGATLKSQLTPRLEEMVDGVAKFDEITKKTATQTIRNLESELNKAAKAVDKTKESQQNLNKKLESSTKIEERINGIKSRQASIEGLIQELKLDGLSLSKTQNIQVMRAYKLMQDQLQVEEELLKTSKEREKSAGVIGKLFEGLNRVPVVGNLIDAKKVTAAINDEVGKTGNKWKAFGAGVKAVGTSLKDSILDPFVSIPLILTGIVGLFKTIFDLATKFNTKIFELSKNF